MTPLFSLSRHVSVGSVTLGDSMVVACRRGETAGLKYGTVAIGMTM